MEATDYYNRGLFSFNNGDYADAIEDWTCAIRLNPNYVLAYNKRARAYDKMGEADKAIDDWGTVLRISPAHNAAGISLKGACLARGIARYNKEDYDGAIADFSRAIELEPEDYNEVIADFTYIKLKQNRAAYYNRGCAYSNIGDYDSAIADWEAALKLDPNNADIKANLERAKAAKNGKQ
jgi:tetratricopeptide (TPR) repeat protein